MRSSAIHREREREREKEVKKCQNSRSFEHLPFLKEGIITFDQKTSFCCIVVSLWTISSLKRAENAAQEIGRYRRHNATPPEGICGVFDALFSHRASNEENTNEFQNHYLSSCRSRKKKTYHALFDVEALHRAFHLLIRVRAWDRRGRRRLSRRRQSLLVVGRHLLRTTPLSRRAYSPNNMNAHIKILHKNTKHLP